MIHPAAGPLMERLHALRDLIERSADANEEATQTGQRFPASKGSALSGR